MSLLPKFRCIQCGEKKVGFFVSWFGINICEDCNIENIKRAIRANLIAKHGTTEGAMEIINEYFPDEKKELGLEE